MENQQNETQALTAKLPDNFAVKLKFEAAIEEAGLGPLNPNSTVAGIRPRVRTSTLTSLSERKPESLSSSPTGRTSRLPAD